MEGDTADGTTSSAMRAMDNAMYGQYFEDEQNADRYFADEYTDSYYDEGYDDDIDALDMSEFHGFYDAEDNAMDNAYLEWYDAAEHYQQAYMEYVEALHGYEGYEDAESYDDFEDYEESYDSEDDEESWANAVVMDGEYLYYDYDDFSDYNEEESNFDVDSIYSDLYDDDALDLNEYGNAYWDSMESEEYGQYDSFGGHFGADYDDINLYDDRYYQFDDGFADDANGVAAEEDFNDVNAYNYYNNENDDGYYHQFHYDIAAENENGNQKELNEEQESQSTEGVPPTTQTNWYWLFELVFLGLVGVAIVFMFISMQKEEWMQTLKTLNEQRANRRKYGFNRINVVFDTTADDSGSDAIHSDDDQVHKLIGQQSSDSGDEHLGSNPSLSHESQ